MKKSRRKYSKLWLQVLMAALIAHASAHHVSALAPSSFYKKGGPDHFLDSFDDLHLQYPVTGIINTGDFGRDRAKGFAQKLLARGQALGIAPAFDPLSELYFTALPPPYEDFKGQSHWLIVGGELEFCVAGRTGYTIARALQDADDAQVIITLPLQAIRAGNRSGKVVKETFAQDFAKYLHDGFSRGKYSVYDAKDENPGFEQAYVSWANNVVDESSFRKGLRLIVLSDGKMLCDIHPSGNKTVVLNCVTRDFCPLAPAVGMAIEAQGSGSGAHSPPAELTDNPYLKGLYKKLNAHPALLQLQVPPQSGIQITGRDIRRYSLNRERAGVQIGSGRGPEIIFSAATYRTRSIKPPANRTQIIAHAKSLLDFVEHVRKATRKANIWDEELSVIIKDDHAEMTRNALKELCKEYAHGLRVPAGGEHAYRQIDLQSEAGKHIEVLARLTNKAYGASGGNGQEKSKLPSNLFVDEKGHLFFCRVYTGDFDSLSVRDTRLYELAYLLGKDICNLAETRFPKPLEIENVLTEDMRIVMNVAKEMKRLQISDPFQRAASDYETSELPIQDPRIARAARLVWYWWMGLWDPHWYNTGLVQGIPVDFDFNNTLSPYDRVAEIDVEAWARVMAFQLLMYQTGDTDPYFRIEDYDVSAMAQAIQAIVQLQSLRQIVEQVGYPAASYVGNIRTLRDTYDFFHQKRMHDGAWLRNAMALTLSSLTGVPVSAAYLEQEMHRGAAKYRGLENQIRRNAWLGVCA